MQSKTDDSTLPVILTVSITLISFCATALSAITGWVPNALGHTGNGPLPAKIEWSRMTTNQPKAAHPAFLKAPVEPIPVNTTLKTTKG
jgi:hypothetical protein